MLTIRRDVATLDDEAEEAACLLAALRAAGCVVFIADGGLYCSPPLTPVQWIGDVEDAIDEWYWILMAIVETEETVH